jgi:hypothetical protein
VHKFGTKPKQGGTICAIEQPTKFELAVNLKSAKTMGLIVPEAFLARADAILE